MAEQPGGLVELVAQEDGFSDAFHRFDHRRVPFERQRPHHRVALRVGDLQVLKHGQVLEHRRVLELAAHPGVHDLMLLHLGELLAAEAYRARGGAGFTADQVEHRGFAGPVGADDHADLLGVEIEGQVVHRLEAVERHRQTFHGEQEVFLLCIHQGFSALS